MSLQRIAWRALAWTGLMVIVATGFSYSTQTEVRVAQAAEERTEPTRILDGSKVLAIERPAKEVVERLSAGASASATGAENPSVSAGLVRWHTSFADACDAVRKSGKPVLLFHLMGRLDQQFC